MNRGIAVCTLCTLSKSHVIAIEPPFNGTKAHTLVSSFSRYVGHEPIQALSYWFLHKKNLEKTRFVAGGFSSAGDVAKWGWLSCTF